MVTVEIRYCVPCGLTDSAVETGRELLTTFGGDLDGVTLVPTHGGDFRVTVDGDTVFHEDEHGTDPDVPAIVGAVDGRIAMEA